MLERVTTPMEIRSIGQIEVIKEGDGADATTMRRAEFEGWASVYDVEDSYRDVIEVGAFSGVKAKNIRMFWQHDSSAPLGVWKSLRSDKRGLLAKGELNLDVPKAFEAYSLMKQGAIGGLSVGFRIPKGAVSYDEQADGSIIRRIAKGDLLEISLVSIPANPEAIVTAVKSFDSSVSLDDFEKAIRHQLGLSRTEAKTLLAGGWQSLQMQLHAKANPAAPAPSVDDAARAAEDVRKQAEAAQRMTDMLREIRSAAVSFERMFASA